VAEPARCRGCRERIDATHYSWCEVGEYATAVTRGQTDQPEPPQRAAAAPADPEPEQLSLDAS